MQMSIDNYPQHWWATFPESKAYDWEVLPQAAGPGEVILSKRNELGLLSNFADTPFELDGESYASLEGFWQMMKFPEEKDPSDPRLAAGDKWRFTRYELSQMLGFDAVAAGEEADKINAELGIDWVSYQGKRMQIWTEQRGEHYELIRRATEAKLEQNPRVKLLLMSTGDLVLKPDHTQPEDAPPSWRYFEIYMEFRAKFNREFEQHP